MRSSWLTCRTGVSLLALLWTCAVGVADDKVMPDEFERSIAPLLVKRCLGCHNSGERRGELDLTSAAGLTKGGESGPAVVASQPDKSLLLERVVAGSMPPQEQDHLTAPEIAALRTWIERGAIWPAERKLSPFEFTTERRAGFDWWAFQPVQRPAVPAVTSDQTAWPREPIDNFVLQKQLAAKLTPAPETDKRTYLRRATLDLLGLPPTLEEIETFLADESPGAYERLIDRLLASPHYGERWGRHWLDVARYGESDGFENDKLRPNAWHYRDYVIRSLNADKPYDQFVREQLAGDVQEPVTRDGIAATGFLVAGPWDEVQNVGASQTEKMRTHEEQLEELIATVSQSFLGLTVNCSRCHDHKFDPIAQLDYYRFKAVFDGVDHGNRPLLTPQEQQAHEELIAPLRARVAETRQALEEVRAKLAPAVPLAKTEPKALVPGKFGQGLDARQGYAAAAWQAEFHQAPWTIECWAKLAGKGNFNILVAHQPKESADHWELYTYAGSGELSLYMPGFAPAEIKSGVDVADDQWHYLAARFDGQKVQLLVDGRQVKEVAVQRQRAGGPTGPLWIGAIPPGLGCEGLIDEVRFSHGLREIGPLPAEPFAVDERTLALFHLDGLIEGLPKNEIQPPRGEPAGESKAIETWKQQEQTLAAELKQREQAVAAQSAPQTYSGMRRQPPRTVMFLRGDIAQPGPLVDAAGLSAIRQPAADWQFTAETPEAERRRRFAAWVTDPQHPLTARVLVNRVWQQHFGQGLVEMPSDLGFNGGRPTHPELLDWLASEFVSDGWSLKRLHRRIMLSATYRQSSRHDAAASQIDAENKLLWHFAPRRIEAETIRDVMLATSGELNRAVGGESFRPFTVTSILTQFYHLIDDGRPDFNRRTIYRMSINTGKSPLLDALDCPAPSISSPKRRSTTTATQALALMNDSFVLRQAERFAARVHTLGGDNVPAQIDVAYRLALGRPATSGESAATAVLIAQHGLSPACWVLLNASEFLYLK